MTADIGVWSAKRSARRLPKEIVAILLGLVLFGSMPILLSLANPAPGPSYDWFEMQKMTLRQTRGMQTDFGWTITFENWAGFADLNFGDWRAEMNLSADYYGGMGILVEISGNVTHMLCQEPNGKIIQELDYTNQSVICLNGWRSWGTNITTIYNGTEILAQDWRNGTWNPTRGIILIADGVSFNNASLTVLYFTPTVRIPEYSMAPGLMIMMLVVLYKVRRRMK